MEWISSSMGDTSYCPPVLAAVVDDKVLWHRDGDTAVAWINPETPRQVLLQLKRMGSDWLIDEIMLTRGFPPAEFGQVDSAPEPAAAGDKE
jgi:hypothetical protein